MFRRRRTVVAQLVSRVRLLRVLVVSLALRTQIGAEPQSAWIRFVGDGPLLSGVTLETSLEVLVVAGPPASWGVSLVDSSACANGGAGGSTSQATENLGVVACGAGLCLDIEAHDSHGNR